MAWKPVLGVPELSKENVHKRIGPHLDKMAEEYCDEHYSDDLGYNLDRAAEARWLTPPKVISALNGEGWAFWQAFLVRVDIYGLESGEVRDTEEAIAEYLVVIDSDCGSCPNCGTCESQ